ncbi:MAG: hypothetical protein ABFQ95_06555 [Pseudomonadota bacterium]
MSIYTILSCFANTNIRLWLEVRLCVPAWMELVKTMALPIGPMFVGLLEMWLP